jgi:hypothetical protein
MECKETNWRSLNRTISSNFVKGDGQNPAKFDSSGLRGYVPDRIVGR